MSETIQESELEELISGKCLSKDRFLVIFSDAEARKKLRQLLLVRDLFDRTAELDFDDLPETDVTLEELAEYCENDGRLDDPDRQSTVRDLLQKEFPEILRSQDESRTETKLALDSGTDTKLDTSSIQPARDEGGHNDG